ncbi:MULTISPECIES: hypothetical protein [unclassified Frondihabitans]|jgi:hypothetical protein|uniref:hypothetical protein n=1 Tax=unclassified Frondihabitans TaxID=2626248 RepID=UPI0006F818F0|nr:MULTISPECIES: hypothetical protein [unclassified Frondihabitans]KQQ26532.1 hypothetical protein ASF54_10930 [Frondihabitans sp. Leaf304]MBF4576741.1 hypothetical protein [Frondihabitans sp. VKM Ac-2883]RPE76513.1 hypothetical protein EDF37_2340 [Frondihabitans sp. PhB153]RPF05212.1 hypothetical protein EDF39_1909 [Frondihabitans sp. PhB161]
MITSILAAEEQLAPVFAPAPVIALIAAAVFTILGFVVFSYKNVANRGYTGPGHDDQQPVHHTVDTDSLPIDEFGHPKAN